MLTRDWPKRVTWPNIPQLKLGNVREYSPIFKTARVAKKDLKDNKDNTRHLGRKYARIFVLGHYLFLVAHSFPRASLSENCSLLGTDNVRWQISEHVFAPNGDYCLYILTQNGGYFVYYSSVINSRPFKNWGISLGSSPVLAWAYSVMWRV